MRPFTIATRRSLDGTAIARSQKHPEAFADVFDRHFAVLHRYIARRIGPDRADDLASQTFTVAFAHRGRYRDDLGTARPWLLGIATNLMRSEYRHAQRAESVVERLGAGAVEFSADHTSGRFENDVCVGVALEGLEAGQREALLLHVWGELSYAEVASAMEIPVGTVRSRISRACAVLREQLDPQAETARERSIDA